MRKASVINHDQPAGILTEHNPGKKYSFEYLPDYTGPPVSLTMPVDIKFYEFEEFPPFFEGLLPEGMQLLSLVQGRNINETDYFSQLICVGKDLAGSVKIAGLP